MLKKSLFTTLKLAIAFSVGTSIFLSLNSSNSVKAESDVKSHAIQTFKNGNIDWTSKTISVVGVGAFKSNSNQGQAQIRLLAERAAIVDGYRQLAEIINGVRVDSQTLVRDSMVESDIVKVKVEGFIKGAMRGDKRITSDGTVEYELHLPIYGVAGLASAIELDKHIIKTNVNVKINISNLSQYHNKYAFLNDKVTDMPIFQISEADLGAIQEEDLNKIDKDNCLACHKGHEITEEVLTKMKNKKDSKITENPDEVQETTTVDETSQENTRGIQNYQIQIPEGKITGIIIDAQNQNLTPSMSPAVLNGDNKQVYIGNWEIDPDYVINNGIVSYASDIDALKKDSRIGNNPIVVKASSVKSFSDVSLSNEDVQKIIVLNKKDKFLEKYSVGLVM